MPNTFAGYPLADSSQIAAVRERFGRDRIPQADLANSLFVPGGRQPARGWILLPLSSYAALTKASGLYGVNYQLQIDDCVTGSVPVTFKGLAIVQARCVTYGVPTDDKIYLVEFTDARGILANKWFQAPTQSQYNLLAPAYPGLYYSASLNSGTAWTWSTMLGNLWGQAGNLGSYPGLPVTPTGTPTGWNFPGISIWQAINDILDHIGCQISVDLTSTSPYGIVQLGAADAAFAALQAKYAGNLRDDLAYIDVGSARVPETVYVLFHRINQYYGTEETVRRDSSQWETTFDYAVPISAPSTFTGATGIHFIWDDFCPRFDEDGTILSGDATTCATIAAERVTQYYQEIYWGTLGFMDRTYASPLPFKTGSQVSGVSWKQKFNPKLKRDSWMTNIVRKSLPLWPEVMP